MQRALSLSLSLSRFLSTPLSRYPGLKQGDRFIPNRPSMNFDLCNHMLLSTDNSENEPQPGSDAPAPLRREFQQALRNTLLSPMSGGPSKSDRGRSGSSVGGSPRVLSFTERPPLPQDRYTNVLKVCGGVSSCEGCHPFIGGVGLAIRILAMQFTGCHPDFGT